MATPARYFDLIREMKDAYNHRLRLVESTRQHGFKPTPRTPLCRHPTVPTVRKWLRRYQQHGPSGLHEHSRACHQQPQKTPATVETQLVELCKTLPIFGARHLIREFDLPISHIALERSGTSGRRPKLLHSPVDQYTAPARCAAACCLGRLLRNALPPAL